MSRFWPKANADFFKIGGGELIELESGDDMEEEFFSYSQKFKKSSHILTEYVLEEGDIRQLDCYFFALAFLYRHCLELVLKAIGFKYIKSEVDRVAFINETRHNLLDIYERIEPFIFGFVTTGINDWIKVFFKDFSTIDKESDSFRYPFHIITTNDTFGIGAKEYSISPIFKTQTHIDIVKFAKKMEIIFDLCSQMYHHNNTNSNTEYKQYAPVCLEEGGGYYSQAVVGYKYSQADYYPYVTAYTECANNLYSQIRGQSNLKNDFFIPMCYLYRNTTELSLKRILFEQSSYDYEDSIRYLSKKKHKILSLWNLLKNDIDRHSGAPKTDYTLTTAEKYIQQISDIDGQADKFRYPVSSRLQKHFQKKCRLDVDNVNAFFMDIIYFLDCVDMQMSANNELQAEIEAEYRSEMESYMDDYY